jgi:hypothetical protein
MCVLEREKLVKVNEQSGISAKNLTPEVKQMG